MSARNLNILSWGGGNLSQISDKLTSSTTYITSQSASQSRRLKPSGIAWLGDIPEGWSVSRLKYIVKVRNDSGYFQDGQDRYIGLENVESNGGGYVATSTEYASNKYAVCLKGDLLYSKLRPYLAKCIVSPFDGFCTNEFIVMKEFKCNREYLRYWLTSPKMTEEIDASTYGAKMPRASEGFILGTKILLPPLPEQRAIAAYLDSVTAKIDALREKIKREIERLDCYKKSAITEAVCHGLDPKSKMKDSGIPWVGKVSEGWKVKRISELYIVRSEKVSDKDHAPLTVGKMGVVPQLEHVAKTNDGENRKHVCPGDFVINSRSDRRGACGISSLDGSVSLINIVLRPRENMVDSYFNWVFHTEAFADEFYKWGKGIDADVWTTHWMMMKKIVTPFPPLPEQREIAAHIDAMVARVDAMVAKRKRQLEALDKLKRTVVYDYVTGKKEVPQ